MDVDRRGVLIFLAITSGVSYAIEGLFIASGFRFPQVPALYGQAVIAAAMWVQGLAAVITALLVTREGLGFTGLRVGSWRPYFRTALIVPSVFAVIYGLTWALGLGHPDWRLTAFRRMLESSGADPVAVPSSGLLLAGLFLASLVVGPTINGLVGFGEELGWRGYLLPKLMPLGKGTAFLLVGVIGGLWHAPLVLAGFNYPGHPLAGVAAMTAMTTALGLFLNELRLRYGSSVLAGWIHGAVNGQAYGVWRLLFLDVNPLLGGFTGLVGIAVWLAVGLWELRRR